ncbi:MAG: PorT family protein [Prevotella sp.]|nr:PorT family protein [Prevotella sp.]
MKKVCMLAALFCCCMVLNAQNAQGKFSIKPIAGINVAGLSGGVSDLYKNKVGFTAGVEAEYGVNDWLGVSLGALYSQQGAKIDKFEQQRVNQAQGDFDVVTKIDGKIKSQYLNLPLLANAYIPGVKGLAVKAGIQVGFCLSSELESTTEIYAVPVETSRLVELDFNSTKNGMKATKVCKSVDFGIPVGLSYEYKNVVLDARYYFGLTKIDNTENPEDCRNRYFSVTLGYRFHL